MKKLATLLLSFAISVTASGANGRIPDGDIPGGQEPAVIANAPYATGTEYVSRQDGFRFGINGGLAIKLGKADDGMNISFDDRLGFTIGAMPQYVFKNNQHALGLNFDFRQVRMEFTQHYTTWEKSVKTQTIFIGPAYTYTFPSNNKSKVYFDAALGYVHDKQKWKGESALKASAFGMKIGIGGFIYLDDKSALDLKLTIMGSSVSVSKYKQGGKNIGNYDDDRENLSSINLTIGLVFGKY